MKGIIIKDMQTPDEMKGKSYVHYKAWHEAYSGIIDDAYLDGVTLEKCEKITKNWPDNVLVAKKAVVSWVLKDNKVL